MFGSLQFRHLHGPLPASAALHAAILPMLVWFGMPRLLPAVPERPIAVDIISPGEFEALSRPEPALPPPEPVAQPQQASPAPRAQPAPDSAPPASEAVPSGPRVVHATKFFASGLLADPANREVAEALPLLAGDEQVIQICNMEALEQLRVADVAALPDAVVGYAYGDMAIAGGTLTAGGGAFRSDGQWFHLQYHCTASADARSISAFDFVVGEAIPEEEWEEHALNANDEGLD